MQSNTPAEVQVTVSMNLPGPYPLYSWNGSEPSRDCRVPCPVPTDIIFTLDQSTIEAGWRFSGYAPNASITVPKHMNLGFSSKFPNHSVTVHNPRQRGGDVHFFSLFYSNMAVNNGAPFSFDPETENTGGMGDGGGGL